MFSLKYTPQAQKHAVKIAEAGFKKKVEELLGVLKINPFQNPPPYKKLLHDLRGCYSRRINKNHRLVYSVDKEKQIVKILTLWGHY